DLDRSGKVTEVSGQASKRTAALVQGSELGDVGHPHQGGDRDQQAAVPQVVVFDEASRVRDRAARLAGEDDGDGALAVGGSVGQLVAPDHQRVVEECTLAVRGCLELVEQVRNLAGEPIVRGDA